MRETCTWLSPSVRGMVGLIWTMIVAARLTLKTEEKKIASPKSQMPA